MARFQRIRTFLQKTKSILGIEVVKMEQMGRYNALMNNSPERLINAITAYNCGYLGEMARIIEEYELRDDKMRTCSKKLRGSVARCDYTIMAREGYENDERAKKHVEILKRFWSGIRATNRFKLDETGGFNLLIKQMMEAESMGYSVHEIVWQLKPDGTLSAEFIKIPLWHFENRTGKLRFLPTTNAFDGIDMKDNEWLVATGDGIGIAASICACLKRCTLGDWAVYCERCGMPIIIGKTGAQFGTKQWENFKQAIRAIGRDARMQIDNNSDVKTLEVGGTGNPPYAPFTEWADRAISSLYRGADLSTMSKDGMAVGASLQGDEMSIIEQDACARLSETLQDKVNRFVIEFETGDTEPLAKLELKPTKKPNVEQDLKVDAFLIENGAQLTVDDALQRYGRSKKAAGEGTILKPTGLKVTSVQKGEQKKEEVK